MYKYINVGHRLAPADTKVFRLLLVLTEVFNTLSSWQCWSREAKLPDKNGLPEAIFQEKMVRV